MVTTPTIQNTNEMYNIKCNTEQYELQHDSLTNYMQHKVLSGDHIHKTQQKIENINGNPWQLEYTVHSTPTHDKLQHNTYSYDKV